MRIARGGGLVEDVRIISAPGQSLPLARPSRHDLGPLEHELAPDG
jgi:hypothetical protein